MAMMGAVSRKATPTVTAPRTPMRNWPWAPMLNRPALNPNADREPAEDERRGHDERVDDGVPAAERTLEHRPVGLEGAATTSNALPGVSSWDSSMTTAPTTRASRMDTKGTTRAVPIPVQGRAAGGEAGGAAGPAAVIRV